MLRRHLLPAFGDIQLDKIGTREIKSFKTEKLDQVECKTVNNMLICLRKLLHYAEEVGVIRQAPRVRFVKVCPPVFDLLDFEEWDRLVRAASDDSISGPAVLLAGNAGLRVGETRAVQWDDIDLVAARIAYLRGYVASGCSSVTEAE